MSENPSEMIPGNASPDISAHAKAWLDAMDGSSGGCDGKTSVNTVKSYGTSFRTFMRWLTASGRRIDDVKSFAVADADAFIGWLVTKGYRPRSIAVKRCAMVSFWNRLVSTGAVESNPFGSVSAKTARDERANPFSDEEDGRIVTGLHRAGPWYPAFLLMRFAGLRVSETLAISSDDISWSAGGSLLRIRVRGVKGRKERWAVMVPADERFEVPHYYQDKVWEAAEARAGEKLMFKGGRGGMFYTYRMMVVRGELPGGFSPHRLRHTFAERLRRDGVPDDVVSEILGVENVRTSRIYVGRKPEDVERDLLSRGRG